MQGNFSKTLRKLSHAGISSARSAHLLRRPYENVSAESIRPIAKRLEWPDAVTVLPKAELLPMREYLWKSCVQACLRSSFFTNIHIGRSPTARCSVSAIERRMAPPRVDDSAFAFYPSIRGFLASCRSMVSYIVMVPPYRFTASSIFAKNSILIFSSIAMWSE